MAIDPNIKQKAENIRLKKKGREVRESLAAGLEAMSEDVVSTVARQGNVEEQLQEVIDNTTGKDVISAPELIAARNGEANLKARLDKEQQQVTAQLAQTTDELFDLNNKSITEFERLDFLTNYQTTEFVYGAVSDSDGSLINDVTNRLRSKDVFATHGTRIINKATHLYRYAIYKYSMAGMYLGKIEYQSESQILDFEGKIKIVVRKIGNEAGFNSIEYANLIESLSIETISQQLFELKNSTSKFEYELGAISSSTGQSIEPITTSRARTKSALLTTGTVIFNNKPHLYEMSVFEYNLSNNFISSSEYTKTDQYVISNTGYYRIVVRKVNDNSGLANVIEDVYRNVGINLELIKNEYSITFEVGNISSNDGADSMTSVTNRARTNMFTVSKGDIIKNKKTDVYQTRFVLFDKERDYLFGTDVNADSEYTVSNDGYVRIVVQRIDGGSVVNELSNISLNVVAERTKPFNTTPRHVELNHLHGKNILNFGDSIALGGYAQIIANRNDMNYYQYAVGGATIANVSGQPRIMTQLDQAKANEANADYVLFNGGTNDAIEGRTTAGVITQGYDDEFDESTFAGGFEATVKKLKLTWLGKKLIYIRVHNMDSRTDLQKTYGDIAVAICKKWSIPVVDLYNEGNLNTHISVMKKEYTNATSDKPDGDGTHPNGLAYQLFYVPPIEAKMKTL